MNLLSLKKEKERVMYMDKRSHERVHTSVDARFFYGNLFYSGTVLNLSEKGMFINTRRCLPPDTMFIVLFRTDDELIKVIAKVKRSVRENRDCDGMGVELLSPSSGYLDYVSRLKASV